MTTLELVPIGTRPPLLGYLRSTWHGRRFLRELVSSRVAAEYAQSFLGPGWLLMTPLLNAVLYFFVFGLLLGAQDSVANYPIFLLTGVLLYTFVARTVSAATMTLTRQRDFVRTIPFPRLILVLSAIGVEARYLVWSLLVLACAALVTVGFHVTWLAAGLAILLLLLFTAGAGLLMARINAVVPDTTGLLPFAIRAGGYLSGAYFPLTAVASAAPVLGNVLQWNPIALSITAARAGLSGDVAAVEVWIALGLSSLVMTVVGVVAFWRGEPGYGRS